MLLHVFSRFAGLIRTVFENGRTDLSIYECGLYFDY